MTPTSWSELKTKRLSDMTVAQRTEFDRAYAEARLAADVGERIRDAREAAGLRQCELARRMGTSQPAIGRLEAGGVGATLTTLQRVATALGLEVNVELRPVVRDRARRNGKQGSDRLVALGCGVLVA